MKRDNKIRYNEKGELCFRISVNPRLTELEIKRGLEEIYNIKVVTLTLDSDFFKTEFLDYSLLKGSFLKKIQFRTAWFYFIKK